MTAEPIAASEPGALAGIAPGSPTVTPAPRSARSERARETTALLGMTVFLASWAMLFASLFFAYGLLRARAPHWPPPDLPPPPRLLPALATLLLASSSLALHQARAAIRAGARAAPRIAGAALLGAGFLAIQLAVWRGLSAAGLALASGSYASVFYGLTFFHALHVGVGVLALAWLAARAARTGGTTISSSPTPLRLWSLYWHGVALVWGLMFVTLYLV